MVIRSNIKTLGFIYDSYMDLTIIMEASQDNDQFDSNKQWFPIFPNIKIIL